MKTNKGKRVLVVFDLTHHSAIVLAHLFHKHIGISMSEWRKEHRKEC